MSNITDLAERLGRAIAESDEAKALQAARKVLNDDPDTAEALKKYRDQSEKMAKLESEGKPIEPDDKRALQELQDALTASATFKKFTEAQMEYVDLMRRVNEAMGKHLAATEPPEPQGQPA
ncbi:MAG: YlbF family regulator [Phycisphaerae bacterium]|nr:YlbF family regulator [Phycisphaerae bacterium]